MGMSLLNGMAKNFLQAITDDRSLQNLLRKEVLRLVCGWKPMKV